MGNVPTLFSKSAKLKTDDGLRVPFPHTSLPLGPLLVAFVFISLIQHHSPL